MNIHFRDVQAGSVEARAIVEIAEGVFVKGTDSIWNANL